MPGLFQHCGVIGGEGYQIINDHDTVWGQRVLEALLIPCCMRQLTQRLLELFEFFRQLRPEYWQSSLTNSYVISCSNKAAPSDTRMV